MSTPHPGTFTYDVTWNNGKGSGELTIQEIVEVSNPENPDTYATYDEREHKWVPVVTAGDTKDGKFSSDDYDVTYYRGNEKTEDFTSAGTIKVKVTGKGNYSYVDETREYTIQKAEVNVSVEGHTSQVTYNSKEQSVEGFDVDSDNKLYNTNNVQLAAGKEAVAKGTNVELYPMGLDNTSFVVADDPNFDVKLNVTDGGLTIQPVHVNVYVGGETITKEYNGQAQSVNPGFKILEVTGKGKNLYDQSNVALSSTGKEKFLTGTNVGTYEMNLLKKYFENMDNNFDADIVVRNASKVTQLTITPAEVNVTVKGKTDTVAYDGQEHSVSGFEVAADNDLYNKDNVTLAPGAKAEAKGTDADKYTMGLTKESFVVSKDDNFNVNYSFESDGGLTIDPAEVNVSVKGNTDTVTYDGDEHKASGFVASTDSKLYDAEKNVALADTAKAEVSRTDAGTTVMGLSKDSFVNKDDNFNVNWNFEGDGGITIEKRAIQVSDSASVVYNGQEQVLNFTASKVTGLVDGDRLNLFGAQVKGTEPGTYTDVTVDRWEVVNDELNVTNNYDLTLTGELTITKADDSASNNGGSSADNGTKASGSSNGSTTTKTADTALPFGVAFAAAAAAFAAFAAARKLRSSRN